MKKKIVDISPPEKVSQKESKIVLKETPKQLPKKKHPLRFLIGIGLFFLLILIVYIGSFFFSKLTLYLTPETEIKAFEEEIEVNISQTTFDLQDKIIPGSFFEIEKEKSQEFEATGQDSIGEKAEGTIRVYNSYIPSTPINLVAATRFLSAEGGKIFKTPERIHLPGVQIKDGEVTPGFTDVKVIAQAVGDEYNIGPSKFSVPNLAGNPLYYDIWAESTEPIEGGFKKEVRVVTEEDLEKAENILEKNIKDLAKSSLKKQLPQGFVLAEGGNFIKNFQVSCPEKAGTQVSKFGCQGKIKMVGLGFKLSELKDLAVDFIKLNIPSSKEFDSQSLYLKYLARNLVTEQGKMILNLKVEVNIYDKIPKQILLSQIKGKSEKEIKEIVFERYPQVETIKFDFWPFWVKKAPDSSEKIKIVDFF